MSAAGLKAAERGAASDDAELDAFLAKEETENDAKQQKNKKKQQGTTDEDEPKLFMELSWSAQRKIGTKEPALRQVEGDSLKQRLRSYRRSIFFQIHCATLKFKSVVYQHER